MFCDPIIDIQGLGKCYRMYEKPRDRLIQMLTRGKKSNCKEFWALSDVSMQLKRGECLGIVGRNGAGKSTLLQMICGTLAPTCGDIRVNGRVAALLELGAGFNPEFTGRENVYFNAALLGLQREEVDELFNDIVAFSGIGDFIDQPVKTYSSGMYVRLAFSVASSINPDILILDEALSVGDAEFSRKSFDRIMEIREGGATILFCSHSMYHIEALSNRVCWLDKGTIQMLDSPGKVVQAYEENLSESRQENCPGVNNSEKEEEFPESGLANVARFVNIEASADGKVGRKLNIKSCETDLVLKVEFASNPDYPAPTVAVAIHAKDGYTIGGALSLYDDIIFSRTDEGLGFAEISFPQIPLLRGDYVVSVVLACERLLHIYDQAQKIIELNVEHDGLLQGVTALPHCWNDLII